MIDIKKSIHTYPDRCGKVYTYKDDGTISLTHSTHGAFVLLAKREEPKDNFVGIKNIFQSDEVVVVIFQDRTKVIVRLSPGEKYDLENAVAYAIAKKIYGTNSQFKSVIKKHLVDNRKKATNVTKLVKSVETKTEPTPIPEKEEPKEKKPYNGEKRGRKPYTHCTTSCYGLQGWVLPIKSRDKKGTIIVMHSGHLYSLKKGEYKLQKGDKK